MQQPGGRVDGSYGDFHGRERLGSRMCTVHGGGANGNFDAGYGS